LSGTSATFSTGLIVSNIADVYPEIKTSAADADAFLGFSNTGDGNNGWSIGRRNTGEFWISNYTANFNSGTRTQPLIIASTGAATFSSTVTSAANFISSSTTDTPSTGTTGANNATYNYLGYSGYWGIRTTATGNNFALDTYNGGTPKNAV
jgi:hypothetical protein